MKSSTSHRSSHWAWVPSLYYAEGIPYVLVMTVAVIMYKRLGVSNTEIAAYTSLLYLPWVIKPIWSPLVEEISTRRKWIVGMQLVVGIGLAAVALSIQSPSFLVLTLAFFAFVAFSSATHDVAADGFYMLAMSTHDQAWFVGIRSTFYRLAMITGQGLLVVLAGWLEMSTGLPEMSMKVSAVEAKASDLAFDPAGVSIPTDGEAQAIVAASESVSLVLGGREPAAAAELIAKVREWNVDRGFYTVEEPKQQMESESPGWVESLEKLIAGVFGVEEAQTAVDQRAGDLGVVLMRLAKPLADGESLVVLFDRRSGDRSLRVAEGGRFEINRENEGEVFAAVVQADPKLDTPSEAEFSARSGNFPLAWATTFGLLAGFFLVITIYHWFALPHPEADRAATGVEGVGMATRFVRPIAAFFRKDHAVKMLAFLLLYRFAEAQLAKLASPFLLDAREAGGLALTTGQVGVVYGTVGVLMLTVGGILGGFAAARDGLKRWILWMVLAINIPNAAYLLLAYYQPESFWLVNLAVGVEQFGYGFGFTAYMLYMLYVSQGEYETVHYALCTGLMALGMMLPGFFCGWLQEIIGYERFFLWVMLSTLPSFLVTWLIPLDDSFGRKTSDETSEQSDNDS